MLTISVRPNGTRRYALELDSESKVEQSHAGETDINAIIRKAQQVGHLPEPVAVGSYGDFADACDYHECQNKLLAADGMFMALPAELRKSFDNDAGAMLDFVNDPDNIEEAREMGLVPKPDRAPPDAPAAPLEPEAPPAEPVASPAVPVAPAEPAG